MAEAAYRASQRPGAATAQTDSDGRATALETRLSELRNQRARLLVEYTDEAPEIVELNKQIALALQEIKETRSRATNTLTTNLETKYQEHCSSAGHQQISTSSVECWPKPGPQYYGSFRGNKIETEKSCHGLLQRSKRTMLSQWHPNNVLVVDAR